MFYFLHPRTHTLLKKRSRVATGWGVSQGGPPSPLGAPGWGVSFMPLGCAGVEDAGNMLGNMPEHGGGGMFLLFVMCRSHAS